MNWQIGDRALFIASNGLPDKLGLDGEIVTLIAYRGQTKMAARTWNIGGTNVVNERCLYPIPDDDAKKKTKWDAIVDADNNCIFKPRELVTV